MVIFTRNWGSVFKYFEPILGCLGMRAKNAKRLGAKEQRPCSLKRQPIRWRSVVVWRFPIGPDFNDAAFLLSCRCDWPRANTCCIVFLECIVSKCWKMVTTATRTTLTSTRWKKKLGNSKKIASRGKNDFLIDEISILGISLMHFFFKKGGRGALIPL